MTTYSDLYTADLRRVVLDILDAAQGEVTVAILKSSVATVSHHSPGGDKLRMELDWLYQRGALTLRRIDGVIDAVVITERGADLANDRAGLLGVAARE